MKSARKCLVALVGTMLVSGADLFARESCPVEAKLLLSAQATQAAIGALGLVRESAGRVYFFDTDSLDLFRQQVIVRVRQGANNDLTVKVRRPDDDQKPGSSALQEQFPCEIDRTRAGAQISYSLDRGYKRLPETGKDIRELLSAAQSELLREAGVFVDWGRVKRVASIYSSKWRTPARSPFGKLSLELWKWPRGAILELSVKAGPEAGASAYADLEQLAQAKGLALDANQDTKTSTVLQAHPASP